MILPEVLGAFRDYKDIIEPSLEFYLQDGDEQAYKRLADELAKVDWERLAQHRERLLNYEQTRIPMEILKPIRFERQKELTKFDLVRLGKALLNEGRVAELILAGGSATRFFKGKMDLPKALYPITPVAQKTFLDIFLQQASVNIMKSGAISPVLIMVSRLTREKILNFIDKSINYGINRKCIYVFEQAHHPRLDMQGRLIITPEGRLVWYGDGHGGVFKALIDSGLRAKLMASGVKCFVLHNVDNPLSRAFDAARIGFHSKGNYQFTITVYKREDENEKVGVIAKRLDTKTIEVVEYSEAPQGLMEARDRHGLLFDSGHVNTNCIDFGVIDRPVKAALYINKKVVVGDKEIDSSTYEVLNQHLTKHLSASRVGIFPVPREEYFLPTKNLHGEYSVDTTRDILSKRAIEAIKAAGGVFLGEGHVGDLFMGYGFAWLGELFEPGSVVVESGGRIYLSPVRGIDGQYPIRGKIVIKENATFILDNLAPFGSYEVGVNRMAKFNGDVPKLLIKQDITISESAMLKIVLHPGSVLIIENPIDMKPGMIREIVVKENDVMRL